MEPTKEQLENLKQIEFDMLKEFTRACEILGLRYYIVCGTLLGAIRHQGFIPWDDDIDVGMPRADYEIFLQQGQALLPPNLFLQSIYTDKEYPMCFAKIRNNDTTFIETSLSKLKINHGAYIDIFPLDYYPETLQEQKRLRKRELWYIRRINREYILPGCNSFSHKFKSVVLKLIFPSAKSVAYKRDALYKSVPQSKLLASYADEGSQKEIVPFEWYGEGTEVIFEGIKVNAPKEYQKYLMHVYGDYMKLPPEEDRIGHHYADVIDLEKSYLEYIK